MHKVLIRLRSVIRRITEPLTRLESTTKAILGVLGVLGTGFVSWDLQRAKPWLFSEWTHFAVAFFALGFVGSFLALYSLEKELDDKKVIQVSVLDSTEISLHSILHFNSGESLHNVLTLRLFISLRNDTEKATRAFFPLIELFGRDNAKGKWELIPLDTKSISGRGGPRGASVFGDLWFPGERFEIPAWDDVHISFWIVGTAPGGAAPFLNRELKARLTVDIMGQPTKTVREANLPRVEGVT